jgi:uncharacterized membrane protein
MEAIPSPSPRPASEIFKYGIIGSKFILLFILLGLSFANADARNFTKCENANRPAVRKFLGEALLIGFCTALSTTFIGWRQNATAQPILSAGFIGFLVFFIFHILMEFSGQNMAEVDPNKLSKREHEHEKYTKYLYIPVGVIAIIMFCIATQVWDTSIGWTEIMIQSLFFAFVNASPFVWLTINRGGSAKQIVIAFFKYFTLFFAGNIGLQTGGFWTHVFKATS